MSIREKLFLWVGSLIVLFGVLMFIFPRFFIQRDVSEASGKVHGLIQGEQIEIEKNFEGILNRRIEEIKTDINALLFLIQEGVIGGFDSNEKRTLWETCARLLTYNPDIIFSQIHIPQTNTVAAIVDYGTQVYFAEAGVLTDDFAAIELTQTVSPYSSKLYLGKKFPDFVKPGFSAYTLFSWKETESVPKLRHWIANNEMFFRRFPPEQNPQQVRKKEADWAAKIKLIFLLAPLYGKQMALNSHQTTPGGIAEVTFEGGEGSAILSQNLFRNKLLFDDVSHFKNHPPTIEGVQIASEAGIFTDSETGAIFLGNTLLVGDAYISLGEALSTPAQQMAIALNKTILWSIGGAYWSGYFPDGTKPSNFLDIEKEGRSLSGKTGMLKVNGETYNYIQFTPFPKVPVHFYVLSPEEKEQTILEALAELQKDLISKISSQMLFMIVLSLIVLLVILGRVSLSITKPIVQLARATEVISSGKYEEISLPKMGGRSDEIAILTKGFEEMVKGLKERETIRGVLNKVVSKDVADEILKTKIHLGGEDRVVTILFSDIRGFSKLTENLPPQQTIALLNTYMTKMSRVIEGEGGVIDKYVGDEIMALYGAPTSHPDHAVRALSAAKLMMEVLKKWNDERTLQKEPVIEMGIGVHSGLVVAGNMGAEDRLNYTVLGANVNLAARLCQVAKPMQIIVSESTIQQPNIKQSFYFNSLEPMVLKGFSEPIKIYEVMGFKW